MDPAVAELNRVTSILREAAARYEDVSRRAEFLEEEKSLLVKEMAEAEVQVRDLKKAESMARSRAKVAEAEAAQQKAEAAQQKAEAAQQKAEAAQLRAELGVSRRREADIVASQGEVVRAVAERIFLSTAFTVLARELAGVVNASVAAAVVEQVAADYPNLDTAKYGYERQSVEEIIQGYAEVLLEYTKSFPVVEALASSSAPLTAEAVRACLVDRDASVEDMILRHSHAPKEAVAAEGSRQPQPPVEAGAADKEVVGSALVASGAGTMETEAGPSEGVSE